MAGRGRPDVEHSRYQQLELIGTGGMGRVFKAWDRVLRRHVALKILIHETAEYAQRLLREASAQAQIDHENICRIYDSGVTDGQVFIAMQYIDGEPLSIAKTTLTLEEKVRAIAAAARGIHAAHRHGIIHRDIKPSNLMAWRDKEGGLHVSVLDFGLARDLNTPGSTITGAVLGTLQYMSPEQAAGHHHRLDRRTDVYSLGATLYELLTGRAPFDANTPVESMMAILLTEPQSFAAAASIPRELETIVLKCLEKEQHRRYDSAGDLADDLERFLAGAPIQARAAPMHRILLRRMKRNRTLAVALFAGVVVAAAVGGVAIQRASVHKEQAVLAERFGEDVRYIHSLLRHAARSPLHDIREERRKAAQHLRQLEQAVSNAGPNARSPGAAAAGAAHLALGNVDAAATLLDEAWELGPRTAQLAYTLSELRGRQFQRRLIEIGRMPDPAEREHERQQAHEKYLLPALQLLREARGVKSQSPGYLDALISYYDGRLEESVQRLSNVVGRYPWLYEARLLSARARTDIGNRYRKVGDRERALAAYAAADQDLRAAMVTAPSEPEVHTQRCALWGEVLQFEVELRGSDVLPHLQRAVGACNAALVALPDSVHAHSSLAQAHARYAVWQYLRDEDFSESAEKACAAADRTVALAPNDEWSHQQRSFAYFWKASSNSYSPEERLRFAAESQASGEQAARLNPNFTHAWTTIGNAALAQHNVLVIHGRDPRRPLHDAIEAYRRAIALDPDIPAPHTNLGHALTHLGEYEELIGRDPMSSYLSAARAAKRGHAVRPTLVNPPATVARAYQLATEYAVRTGRPAEPHAGQALRWAETAMKISSREPVSYIAKALTYLAMAEEKRRRGEPHDDVRRLMNENIAKSLETAPESGHVYTAAARIALWNVRHGGDSLDAKVRALDEVLERRDAVRERHGDSADVLIVTSIVARERAALSFSGRSGNVAIARQWRSDAFALNPVLAGHMEARHPVR